MKNTTHRKRAAIALLLALVGMALGAGSVSANAGCKKKEQILTEKIALAKARGNQHQVAGLEEALAHVRTYCTDDSLRAKAAMKVADKRQEVMERETDLEEARQKNDPKKIAKREKKLQEARLELEQAEKKFNALPR